MIYDSYPKVIEIQFHNRCNSNCLICPYKDMKYTYEKMDNLIFEKFLNELDESKIERIIPYLNNEPFLDPFFIDKIEKIRERYKKLEIEISSNVSLINEKHLEKLAKLNITELRLSVFGYKDETYNKMMPGLNKEIVFNKLEMISKMMENTNTIISIVMIDDNEIAEEEFISMKSLCDELNYKFERWGYLDRSDNVSYKSNGINNINVCDCEQNRPKERMHILSNGDVILCCQDWEHTNIIGNIRKNSIREIWNSEKYKDIRDSLYNKGRIGPKICQKCKLGR